MAILPNIHILATGGTIAGKAQSVTMQTEYQSATLSGQDLVDAVPSIAKIAQVQTEQIANVASESFTFGILLKLAKRVNELLADNSCEGIVITHGTDTLEETAYFLNLVVKSTKPVVVVGAMLPATAIGADGPKNLLDAVSVASNKESHGKGVLVVLGGQINSARDCTKTNTSSLETFKSHNLGCLGFVIDSKVSYYREVLRLHTSQSEFDIMPLENLARVDIVYQYLDASLEMHKAIIASKPNGIVIACTGNGTMSDKVEALYVEAIKQGIIVVRSSRTGSGITTANTKDKELGFVSSDNINPQKARILLTLALNKYRERESIQECFMKY